MATASKASSATQSTAASPLPTASGADATAAARPPKTTKKIAASAKATTKKASAKSKTNVDKAPKAPQNAAPAARTTLAAQAIWPFPVGPKP